jgi:hypothetical protein
VGLSGYPDEVFLSPSRQMRHDATAGYDHLLF